MHVTIIQILNYNTNKKKTKYQIDTIKYRKFISSNPNKKTKYSPNLKNNLIKKLR